MRNNFAEFFNRLRDRWNLWVGLGAVVFSGVICLALFLFVWLLAPGDSSSGVPDRAVVTRLPAPTYTAVVQATATVPVLETEPDGIMVGMEVEVFGTGGSGLRFRVEPGVNSEIKFIAPDQGVYLVDGGPVEEDGFVWWFLVSPQVGDRRGWAVSNYLRPAVIN